MTAKTKALSLLSFLLLLASGLFGASGSFYLGAEWDEGSTPVKTVTLCVDPDWEPFEKVDESGRFTGIAADLIALIGKRANVRFELIPTQTWGESLKFSREGKCMVLGFLNKTPDREEWLIFTEPYFREHNVFITREEHDFISDPAGLMDKTVALPLGTSIEERIRRNYPNLEILYTEDETAAFQMVNERKADMTLRSLTMAAYVIKKEAWFNLKIAGQMPGMVNELRMGVAKDEVELRDILNDAIATLTPQEVQQAINNHVSIEMVTPVNYRLLIQIGLLFLVVILLIFLWNYQLRKFNKKLETKQKDLIDLSDKLAADLKIRRRIEEKLRENERQLEGVISNLPGFVYRCSNDEKYTLLYITDVCEQITGYKPDDLLFNERKSFAEIIHPEDLEKIRSKWDQAIMLKKHFNHEYRILHASGEIRWVWESGNGVFNMDGELLYLEGFIFDISKRKVAEEMIRIKNKEMETFLSVVSHDLRSPLVNVQGFSDRIINQISQLNKTISVEQFKDETLYNELRLLLGESVPRSLGIIDSSVEKMDKLIEGLLAISRTGREKMTIGRCDMNGLISRVLQELSFQLEDINTHTLMEELHDCYGDEKLLNQLFSNLIDNAIKYRKPDQPLKLTISSQIVDGFVEYAISDNGLGISERNQEKIWTVFYRVDPHSEQKGEGIGLNLVAAIVEKHKGSIRVESKEGEGSTFYVKLRKKAFEDQQQSK